MQSQTSENMPDEVCLHKVNQIGAEIYPQSARLTEEDLFFLIILSCMRGEFKSFKIVNYESSNCWC